MLIQRHKQQSQVQAVVLPRVGAVVIPRPSITNNRARPATSMSELKILSLEIETHIQQFHFRIEIEMHPLIAVRFPVPMDP